MKVQLLSARSFSKGITFLILLTWAATQSAAAGLSSSGPGARVISSIPGTLVTPSFKALLAQTRTQGPLRAIVGLRTSFEPEGRLPSLQAIQAQRRAIGQAQNDLLNQLANRNAKLIRQFASIPHLVVQVDAAALAMLGSSPSVASIVEDRRRGPSLRVSVPFIGAPNAWADGYTGSGQTVAILDTGVDKTHPFLTGKVVSEACYSTTYPPDTATSLCPGGVAQSTAPGSGLNCDVNAIPICIHGTHVAGIAAGRDNGSIGFSGVAKDANIIAIQIYSYFSDCGCVEAYDSDILAGLEHVAALSSSFNIAAVNLSLGGNAYTTQAACDADFPAYRDMFGNLRSLGIASIVASGNDYSYTYIEAPGCVSTAISVGSVQDGTFGGTPDAVSDFSNSASFLTLLAPGQYIYSSVPGGRFEYMMGTSMATPHVTGAWAILKSALPSGTVDQIRAALSATGKPITDPRNGITTPRIRIDAAVCFLVGCTSYFPIISK